MTFTEYHHYSPFVDAQAVRLSAFDAHGGEFFTIIRNDGGRAYRDARDAALNAIADAMESGRAPGKVEV